MNLSCRNRGGCHEDADAERARSQVPLSSPRRHRPGGDSAGGPAMPGWAAGRPLAQCGA